MVAWLCLYSCCACSSYAVAWVTCHFTLRSCRSRAFAIHYLHLFTTFQPPHLHQSVEFDVPSTAQFSPPQASLTQAPAANGRQEKKVEICRTGRLRLGTWAMHSMDTDTDTVWYRRSAVGFQWCPHAGQGEKHSSSPTSIECKCAAVTSADTMKLSSFTPLLSCFVFFVSIYIYMWCLVIGTFPRQKRTTRKSEATTLALPHWISWFLFVFELPKWNVYWHIVSHSEASAQYTGGSCQILGFDRPAFFCLAAIIRHLNARKSKLNAIPTRSYECT